MRNGNIVAILLIVAAAYFLFAMQDNREDAARESLTEEFSRGVEVSVDEDEQVQDEDPEPDPEPTVQTNECGFENYAKPDYSGTQKEGQSCKQANDGEEDMECINNPPVIYDGITYPVEGFSDPELTCCLEDGTCQW